MDRNKDFLALLERLVLAAERIADALEQKNLRAQNEDVAAPSAALSNEPPGVVEADGSDEPEDIDDAELRRRFVSLIPAGISPELVAQVCREVAVRFGATSLVNLSKQVRVKALEEIQKRFEEVI